MAIRYPQRFGFAFVFSMGMTDGIGSLSDIKNDPPAFFLAAGELEEGFYDTTRGLAMAMHSLNIPHKFVGRVAGHDPALWQEEFVSAVVWAFGKT